MLGCDPATLEVGPGIVGCSRESRLLLQKAATAASAFARSVQMSFTFFARKCEPRAHSDLRLPAMNEVIRAGDEGFCSVRATRR